MIYVLFSQGFACSLSMSRSSGKLFESVISLLTALWHLLPKQSAIALELVSTTDYCKNMYHISI